MLRISDAVLYYFWRNLLLSNWPANISNNSEQLNFHTHQQAIGETILYSSCSQLCVNSEITVPLLQHKVIGFSVTNNFTVPERYASRAIVLVDFSNSN